MGHRDSEQAIKSGQPPARRLQLSAKAWPYGQRVWPPSVRPNRDARYQEGNTSSARKAHLSLQNSSLIHKRSHTGVGRSDHVSAGVRITKEWRGETYHVDRTDAGYLWDEKTFKSLSAVAQAITGVKRNGPAFFGLREEPKA